MKKIKKRPIIYMDDNNKYKGRRYWVIRTMEKEPRYIETILKWDGTPEYSLVFNVNYGKVFKSFNPPYRTADKFEEITGIECCFQEVDEKAFKHYKDYEAYFTGQRELTMQEKIQLKEEIDEYRREHDLLENNKGRFYND